MYIMELLPGISLARPDWTNISFIDDSLSVTITIDTGLAAVALGKIYNIIYWHEMTIKYENSYYSSKIFVTT